MSNDEIKDYIIKNYKNLHTKEFNDIKNLFSSRNIITKDILNRLEYEYLLSFRISNNELVNIYRIKNG